MIDLIDLINPIISYFSSPSKRFYIGYLISAGVIASLYFWLSGKKMMMSQAKSYWLHPSALLDYAYFVVGGLVKIYLVMPLVVSVRVVILWVNSACLAMFGYVHITSVNRTTVAILYTIIIFVVSDLSRYWLHRLMHSIPSLWVFHKVHHSAEVLNPATFYRIHPVENLLFGLRYAIVIGGVTGIFVYLFGANIRSLDILGANALLFIFNFLGGNLRHSHIELSYPTVLEKIFISPRQHQLHHTYHFTRYNYGGYLAIWDTIFGTLKVTADAKPSPYGLGEKENARFQTLLSLFITPFSESITKWHKKYIKKYS